MSNDFLPVQRYEAQRKPVDKWRSQILKCDVISCEHCPSSDSSNDGEAHLSPPSSDTPPSNPSQNPIPSPRLEETCESIGASLSALKLGSEQEEIRVEVSQGRGNRGRKGKRGGRRGGSQGRGGQEERESVARRSQREKKTPILYGF